MSIRNGELDLANRPWTYLTLIGTTLLMALVVGGGVGFAVNGKPDPAAIAVMGHAAAPGLRSTGTPPGTPTLSATNMPAAAVNVPAAAVSVPAPPPATKAAAAATPPAQAQVAAAAGVPAPISLGGTNVTPTLTSAAKAAPSSNSLPSILPTVTPSSRAAVAEPGPASTATP
jgi:hypothetical protein